MLQQFGRILRTQLTQSQLISATYLLPGLVNATHLRIPVGCDASHYLRHLLVLGISGREVGYQSLRYSICQSFQLYHIHLVKNANHQLVALVNIHIKCNGIRRQSSIISRRNRHIQRTAVAHGRLSHYYCL